MILINILISLNCAPYYNKTRDEWQGHEKIVKRKRGVAKAMFGCPICFILKKQVIF